MLKQYLYYKILQTYKENPKRRRFDSDSTTSSEDESSSEDEARHRAALRLGARVRRRRTAVPENGENFDRDKADGIWISLDEDISNLIADFKKFDMVKFWKSSPGKAILRQISNIPARGERDAALPRGARRGRARGARRALAAARLPFRAAARRDRWVPRREGGAVLCVARLLHLAARAAHGRVGARPPRARRLRPRQPAHAALLARARRGDRVLPPAGAPPHRVAGHAVAAAAAAAA